MLTIEREEVLICGPKAGEEKAGFLMNQRILMPAIKIIECPRDAMQGWPEFIDTATKVRYMNQLLKVGFDTLDCGSFVSPKAIPQMRDTAEVIEKLEPSDTKLLVIVANQRGAQDAVGFDKITYLGFPFSISEEFQKRNTNSTIEESLVRVEEIQNLCLAKNKELVIYISMGFGNPYGEEWNTDIVIKWTKKLAEMGIKTIALSDTVGVSTPENISYLFSGLIPAFPGIEFGAHLHSHPETWKEKIIAAEAAGCKRFDSAMKGIGGCPMANDDLVGNLATENLTGYFGFDKTGLKAEEFHQSMMIASTIFHD